MGFLPAGDFSFYDHVLDHAVLLGCPPARFGFDARALSLKEYFELARGSARQPAMEMTKWFDTNYHYLVPELEPGSRFDGGPGWYFDDVREALSQGRSIKPVLVGPLTFRRLSKSTKPRFDRLQLIESLVQGYARVMGQLKAMGIEWVQLDEPVLATELEPDWLEALERTYVTLAGHGPRILLATYFGGVGEHLRRIVRLPVQGIHLDLVRDPMQWSTWTAALPPAIGWGVPVDALRSHACHARAALLAVGAPTGVISCAQGSGGGHRRSRP